jgi:glutamate synthase domain-containing protein 1
MKELGKVSNTYDDGKVIDACSIFGIMDTSGRRFSGEGITRAIGNMHDRGNGLGGGFAVYGLYPEHAYRYAFHLMYLGREGKEQTEAFLEDDFKVVLRLFQWQEYGCL